MNNPIRKRSGRPPMPAAQQTAGARAVRAANRGSYFYLNAHHTTASTEVAVSLKTATHEERHLYGDYRLRVITVTDKFFDSLEKASRYIDSHVDRGSPIHQYAPSLRDVEEKK